MKEDDNGFIDKKTMGILENIKEKNEDGTIDQDSKDAVEALNMAGQLMEAVMAGRQLDISFFSVFANSSIKKMKRNKARRKKREEDS